MLQLDPTLAAVTPNNEAFFAVRAEPGCLVLASSKGVVKIPGEGIVLGSKFFNIDGVLVKDDEVIDYINRYRPIKGTGLSTSPILSYGQLRKKNKGKRRK